MTSAVAPAQKPDLLRLVLGRRIFDDAMSLVDRSDEVGRMTAVVLLDLAVETVLKAVLTTTAGPVKPSITFDELVSTSKKLVSKAPNAWPGRNARNAAVHDGVPPAREAMPRFGKAAKSICAQAFAVLGEDFDTFTMRSLVRHPWVVRALEDAEAALGDGELDRAIALAGAGFDRLLDDLQNLVATAFRLVHRGPGVVRDRASEQLLRALGNAAVGFDLDERLRFQELRQGKTATYSLAGTFRVTTQGPPRPSRIEDAHWCIEYVARHAHRMEEMLPSLVDSAKPIPARRPPDAE